MRLDCARPAAPGRFYESYEEVTQVQDRGLAAYIAELVGTLLLVFFITSVVALSVGGALGFLVMVLGPLTGGSFNPARWFGPALVSNEFADPLAYILGPVAGALVAAALYKFVIEPASGPVQEAADTVAPRGPAPPAGEAPPLRQERGPAGPGGPPPASP